MRNKNQEQEVRWEFLIVMDFEHKLIKLLSMLNISVLWTLSAKKYLVRLTNT